MDDKIKRATECLTNGETARGRRLLEQVLRTDPDNVRALWLLCGLQEARGDADGWLNTLKKLRGLLPDELAVLDEQARAFAKVKRLPDSLVAYQEFLHKHPDSSSARYNYAHYLGRSGDFREAIIQYEKLLDGNVEKSEEVHLNLSNLLSEHLNQYQRSKDHLEKALKLNPKYTAAWFNLGNLNEQMGELLEARRCFEQATEIGDEEGGALARIADLTRFDEDDEAGLLMAMEKKLHLNENPNPDLMFSLGRAYEQKGKHKESLYMYESANSIDRHFLPPYNQESMAAFIDKIQKEYSDKPSSVSTELDLGQVFICGNFRSGSTLLEQMLAGHANFSAGGERGYFRKIARDSRVKFPTAKGLDQNLRLEFADQYNRETLDLFGQGVRVTDKRPDNLLLIGLIKQVLPGAKFIITRREPLDVAWSIFTTRFGPELPYATSMENILHFIRLQERIAEHWSNVYDADVTFVSYEDLVRNPKEELTRLLGVLGEDWDEGCLNFRELKNFVTTASSAQVRRPLNSNSLGRSQPYHEYIHQKA